MTEHITLTTVAPGIWFVEGPASNWVVLADESSVTLVDTGYPADAPIVEASIEATAGRLPVTDLVITHGHSDHIGAVPHFVAAYGARVWAARDEIPNVQREVLHQVGFRQVLPRLWRPRYARWAWHAIRAGGLRDLAITEVRALPLDQVTRFSGRALLPRLTPGHTPGSVVIDLPEANAVITGDTVITAHPTVARQGPQLLDALWHWRTDDAVRAARPLLGERDRALLPGHGPATGALPTRRVPVPARRR